jgi:hypothetical protein
MAGATEQLHARGIADALGVLPFVGLQGRLMIAVQILEHLAPLPCARRIRTWARGQPCPAGRDDVALEQQGAKGDDELLPVSGIALRIR